MKSRAAIAWESGRELEVDEHCVRESGWCDRGNIRRI